MKKRYYPKEVECPFCHQKVKPILKLNRAKSDFYGVRYTGLDKKYWLVCPNCKAVVGAI
ncbi:MAG: hypothetical protein JSW60_02750 [Thermoplasmatales archaeon]|nr:MAG: hypothetical protein JSW60_02750 [Thermoplasmatales archaeon]